MKILRYVVSIPADIVLTLTALLLAPALSAWSVLAGVNVLPCRWQWWSTVDNTLDGGFDQGSYPMERKCSAFWLWWYRMLWVCRNPAYGWATYLLGCRSETFKIIKQVGVDEKIESTYYVAVSPEGYWCARGMLRRWRIGLRFGFGWKLNQGTSPHMLVFSVALRFF